VAFIEKTYEIPEPRLDDYRVKWAVSRDGQKVAQVVKELAGFASPGKFGFGTRYEHGLRLVQMLWPKDVQLWVDWKDYRTGEPVRIWNNYFLDSFRDCCERNRVSFTGCSSSGKTFATSVYALLMFMSSPSDTTIMVSTTAGTDAERRIWREIKNLHMSAENTFRVGTLIDSLKAITFDPSRELANRKELSSRDLGSGIIVIPIPKGSEGHNALGKIIGTKNKRLIWIIDEMPHMIDGVLRPESNLESNIFYQLLVIGNANRKTDPHGRISEPTGGWDSIGLASETWWAKDCWVRFLHGERSPNWHPAVDPDTREKSDFPFPYLSNPVVAHNVALRNGFGKTPEEQVETGKKTIDYMRFAIGFWYGEDVEQTVLSAAYVREHGGDEKNVAWSGHSRRVLCGFDPAWTSGGDANQALFGELGIDSIGEQVFLIGGETFPVRSMEASRESFRKEISRTLVEECISRGCRSRDVYIDISGDGGLMALEMNRVWSEITGVPQSVTGISSLENTDDISGRYHDVVTQLWFHIRDALVTRRVRGFNVASGYAKDLFERRYESVGKGKIKIEPKGKKGEGVNRSGFRSRMGRSPDCGDAAAYLFEGARRCGLKGTEYGSKRSSAGRRTIDDLVMRRSRPPGGFATREDAALAEPEEWVQAEVGSGW